MHVPILEFKKGNVKIQLVTGCFHQILCHVMNKSVPDCARLNEWAHSVSDEKGKKFMMNVLSPPQPARSQGFLKNYSLERIGSTVVLSWNALLYKRNNLKIIRIPRKPNPICSIGSSQTWFLKNKRKVRIFHKFCDHVFKRSNLTQKFLILY